MSSVAIPPEAIRVSSIYQPWPKQVAFHSSPARYRLFGGAQGPGKSLALLWEALLHCLEYPGSNALLLRRTYPELDAGLITHFEQQVLAKNDKIIGGRKNFNKSDRVVKIPNGSTLRFGYAEAFKDVYRYDGPEYVFIGFDELTQFPFRIWEHLRLRNRCPVPGSRPCMAGATNPGGENGEWVKALWIDKQPFAGMEAYQYDPQDYEFIPATVLDNPIYANDVEYIKNLQQMSPGLRAQRYEGRWDKFEGQFFSNWEPARHIFDSRNIDWRIPVWWPRWISMDWGFAHHAAIHWHTIGEFNSVNLPAGAEKVLAAAGIPINRKVCLTYRELIVREHTANQIAEKIAKLSAGENITHFYLSPDAFARKQSDNTIAIEMGQELRNRGMIQPSLADNDRVGGWNLMYQMLEIDAWMIYDCCVETIKAIPQLVRDPENLEDVKKTENLADDIGDGLRYGLKSHLRPRSKPEDVQHLERLAQIPDLQSKFLYHFEHETKKVASGAPIKQHIVPRSMR